MGFDLDDYFTSAAGQGLTLDDDRGGLAWGQSAVNLRCEGGLGKRKQEHPGLTALSLLHLSVLHFALLLLGDALH